MELPEETVADLTKSGSDPERAVEEGNSLPDVRKMFMKMARAGARKPVRCIAVRAMHAAKRLGLLTEINVAGADTRHEETLYLTIKNVMPSTLIAAP